MSLHYSFINADATFRKDGFSKRSGLILHPEQLAIKKEAPEDYTCQFIPAYSTLGIDEAQTYFPSRDGDGIKNYQFNFFEKHRHNNLDIYFATPQVKLLDKRIRGIAEGICIIDRKVYQDKFGSTKVTWIVDKVPCREIDAYLSADGKMKRNFSKREKIICNYNIFKLYDPEAFKSQFCDGFDERSIEFQKWGKERGIVQLTGIKN